MKNNFQSKFRIIVSILLICGSTFAKPTEAKVLNFKAKQKCKVFAYEGKNFKSNESNIHGHFLECKITENIMCKLLNKNKSLIDYLGMIKSDFDLHPEIRRYMPSLFYRQDAKNAYFIDGYAQKLSDEKVENPGHARLALRLCNMDLIAQKEVNK